MPGISVMPLPSMISAPVASTVPRSVATALMRLPSTRTSAG
jgi:hypothetical protein